MTNQNAEFSTAQELIDIDQLVGLKSEVVSIEHIFVDPNNPRLLEMGYDEVPDNRILESGVQQAAIENMKQRIGIKDITEKVKQLGFLKVDRVVVRPIDDQNFVVLEGNRRITALKTLLEQHNAGTHTLNAKVLASISNLEILIYTGEHKRAVWVLQGLRHLHGIKNWGPLQQAKFLVEMRDTEGLTLTTLASMTGLGRTTVGEYIRAYKGWLQAKNDDDYGDVVATDHFSLFAEAIFKKPTLKEWLGWTDNGEKFNNEENLKKLLSWYVVTDNKRIKEAKEVRDTISKLLLADNRPIFEQFENGDIELETAKTMLESKRQATNTPPQKSLNEIMSSIETLRSTIHTLPIVTIIQDEEKLSSFISVLLETNSLIQSQVELLTKLKPTVLESTEE